MARYCSQCGSAVREGAGFCSTCGAKLDGAGAGPDRRAPNVGTVPTYAASRRAGASVPVHSTSARYGVEKTPKKKRHIGLIVILALAAFAVTGFLWPGFLKNKPQPEPSSFASAPRMARETENPAANSRPAENSLRVFSGGGIDSTTLDGISETDVTLGALRGSGCVLSLGRETFPEGAVVAAAAVPSETLLEWGASERFDRIVSPVDITCDVYDGSFFGTDVTLTVPMPKLTDESELPLDAYVFAYYNEEYGEIRYLWPDSFDPEANTMSVVLPHWTTVWAGRMKDKAQLDAFIREYSMDIAIKQDEAQKAASELEPYLQAKAEALGLTKEAAKDLVQTIINHMGSGWEIKGKGNEQVGTYIETATGYSTECLRGILEGDSEKSLSALDSATNSMIQAVWSELDYTNRMNEVMRSEFVGGGVTTVVANAGSLGSLLGYMAEGDKEGALRELGGILEGIHPAAALGTKGAAFVAASVNQAFTNWKANAVEELYQIYKNGGEDVWGNEVKAGDRDSFLTYLYDSSGFGWQKGIARFYNMDKVAEVCEKYGWDAKTYAELDEHYRNIFDKRAEDSLLEYFETRLRQEAAAEKIAEQLRAEVAQMLDRGLGALCPTNYNDFFGEENSAEYDVRDRLEKLAAMREIIARYVDEEALNGTTGRDAGINYGTLLNWWVSNYNEYPPAEARERFLEYLKEFDLQSPEAVGRSGGKTGGKAGQTDGTPQPDEPTPTPAPSPTPSPAPTPAPGGYVWSLNKVEVYQYPGWTEEKTGNRFVFLVDADIDSDLTIITEDLIGGPGGEDQHRFIFTLPGQIVTDKSGFTFMVTTDPEVCEGHYGDSDYAYYDLYVGRNIKGKSVPDPEDPDLFEIPAGTRVPSAWASDRWQAGDPANYYDASGCLPEAGAGKTIQAIFYGANWTHCIVELTYRSIPAGSADGAEFDQIVDYP